jgi:ParB-like chromosome segregation protein Spo0J
VLSQSNVRRVKAGVSIEELADDIARRTLLQSLSVRPVADGDGKETGMFGVPAGGRRFRALELLVKQKRMSKTQPVTCVVRTGGLAEEDSLAKNVHREALHPLDQFRAFQTLREKGLSEEDIAVRFFVSVTVVKQRLKLAAVSDKLLDVYAGDGMTLEQLMAFTVTNDHERQEQVWEQISRGHNTEPSYIRRQLTEGAVRASGRRALFVGVEAYEAAGGVVTRDLFEHDGGGWLEGSGAAPSATTAFTSNAPRPIYRRGLAVEFVALDSSSERTRSQRHARTHQHRRDRITALLETWADAVRRRDIAAILAHHEPDMVMFDLPPPLQCKRSRPANGPGTCTITSPVRPSTFKSST